MDQIRFRILFRTMFLVCFSMKDVLSIQKREWVDSPAAALAEGDVSCFSEYMEMQIHSTGIEGLGAWLSGALQIHANLTSVDQLNLQVAACGFTLHPEPDDNFIFRVRYTGCFVQQQYGHYVLELNLMRRISRIGGRSHTFVMKCPVVSVLLDREYIQCDPEYIQVTRQVPYDTWNDELSWSLSLSNEVIVAVEDASLIQMNIDMNGPNITVQGRRNEVLNPLEVIGREGEFLALKLVSGQYTYSMEATCPKVTKPTAEATTLHIFKRRMGLTKRGSYDAEQLTVSNVSMNQTQNFTLHEAPTFVTITVPTAQILQKKTCRDNKQLWQPFYRVDVVLTFRETNHKMHWTMENTLPCTARSDTSDIKPSTDSSITESSKPIFKAENLPAEPCSANHSPVSEETTRAGETSAEFSTTNSPQTQTEASDFNFSADEMSRIQSGNVSLDSVFSINATDFQNVTFSTMGNL